VPFRRQWEKNIVEQDGTQMTIWRMCFACWITKATNTHSEYVIVVAFPLQQWLHQRASMLRYRYNACLVCCNDISLLRRLHILAIKRNGLKLFCCSIPSGKIVEQSVVREFWQILCNINIYIFCQNSGGTIY